MRNRMERDPHCSLRRMVTFQTMISNFSLASFYLLSKVHKNLENPPDRPVISGSESLTEHISKYIDYFIKPFVTSSLSSRYHRCVEQNEGIEQYTYKLPF
jgi:hypothetical protein